MPSRDCSYDGNGFFGYIILIDVAFTVQRHNVFTARRRSIGRVGHSVDAARARQSVYHGRASGYFLGDEEAILIVRRHSGGQVAWREVGHRSSEEAQVKTKSLFWIEGQLNPRPSSTEIFPAPIGGSYKLRVGLFANSLIYDLTDGFFRPGFE